MKWRCELAVLPDGRVERDVELTVEDGRYVAVEVHPPHPPDAETRRLNGLVLPGAANGHSHAFHRALRGRTHDDGGTFWTWREQMYAVAAQLTPDSYRDLAEAVYAEMMLAGFTGVGEFHYVHHRPDGTPYDDDNAFGEALLDAARSAGIRSTLLDTCYLAGGIGEPLGAHQRRFGDGVAGADPYTWADRVSRLHRRHAGDDRAVIGAAVHSVRAVPPEALSVVADWARDHDAPLHVHVSEQPAENAACREAYGIDPVQLLARQGVLGPRTSAVHATHITRDDIATLAATRTAACFCPTTERDLGDGIGPADELLAAGVELTLGTDGHSRIDAFEEARAVEHHLRLRDLARGRIPPAILLQALTAAGHRRLGFPDAGQRADLVAVDLASVRTAGANSASALATVLFAADAIDVTDVVADGDEVVCDGRHRLGDVGARLARAIAALDPPAGFDRHDVAR